MVCEEEGRGPYMKKGHWSPDEDERLYTQITNYGVGTWSTVAELAGLQRSGKSCRLRWMNYLRPDLKKQPISKQEEDLIISLQKVMGNRWSAIAARMPGRTDNDIKNYWNARIRKKTRKTDVKVHNSTEICQNEGASYKKSSRLDLDKAVHHSTTTTFHNNSCSEAPPRLQAFSCQLSPDYDCVSAKKNSVEQSKLPTLNSIPESNKFDLVDEYVNFLMSLPDVVPDILP
ncbi:unnamed protein product [Urochloa humidicola]